MTDTATRTEKKLSVIRRGVWKTRWCDGQVGYSLSMRRRVAGGEEYVTPHEFRSSAEAEAFGERMLRQWQPIRPFLRFLGPVFFPDKSDP